MISYVIWSVVWSLIGFVGGLTVGWMVRQDSPRHATARTLLGLLILGITAWLVWSEQQTTECQQQANAAFAAGLAERTEAAGIERAATAIRWRFIREALAEPVRPKTPAEQEADRIRWLGDLDEADRLVAEADAKRAASPSSTMRDCS